MDIWGRKNKEMEAGKQPGLRLTVITPEEQFYDGRAESVMVKTMDGYLGFMEHRAPACVLLHDEGEVRFREPGTASAEMARILLRGGFAFMDEELTIYTDFAEWPDKTEENKKSTPE